MEHMAVRTRAGLFDVSHMGEVTLKGKDALENVQMLVTNDCSKMYDGQVKYSPMCYETGGVVDDLLVYRISVDNYLIVINAANRQKDVEWMKQHLFGEITFEDISDHVAQIALQGPKALEILKKITDDTHIPNKYYTFIEKAFVAGKECLISRTGYTGEDGFELYCAPGDAEFLWNTLLEQGESLGLIPAGLGARDTLRLEAAMPLYGHELSTNISPLEAGLDFAVKMEKPDFLGKKGIEARGILTRKRVGLKVTERGIARENCPVMLNGQMIGQTSSGTHCPYLDQAVAMGLLDIAYTEVGTKVEIEVRGRKLSAEVIPLPFYKREKH
jgi:aminomethyltransferase